jgi:hypothetical protein
MTAFSAVSTALGIVVVNSWILEAETAHFWALTFTGSLILYEITCRCRHGLGWLILFNALFQPLPRPPSAGTCLSRIYVGRG